VANHKSENEKAHEEYKMKLIFLLINNRKKTRENANVVDRSKISGACASDKLHGHARG
jgi:hypothetical protein